MTVGNRTKLNVSKGQKKLSIMNEVRQGKISVGIVESFMEEGAWRHILKDRQNSNQRGGEEGSFSGVGGAEMSLACSRPGRNWPPSGWWVGRPECGGPWR